MHLYLWHIDRHVHCSDALIYVSMSDMPPTDLTVWYLSSCIALLLCQWKLRLKRLVPFHWSLV
jgi:hypothetical protein